MNRIIPLVLGLIAVAVITITVITPEEVFADSSDGDWFIREHCTSSGCHTLSNPPLTRFFWEYRISPQIITANGFDGVLKLFTGSIDSNITASRLGKVFDKAELDGKLITWEVSESRSGSPNASMTIYDGELDPTVSSFNGTSTAPSSTPCGVDCFQDIGGIPTSGSGGGILVMSAVISDLNIIHNFTGSADLSSFDSPTGKVTLLVTQGENNFNAGIGSNHFQITVEDIGTYKFKEDPINGWSGATISPCIPVGINGCVNTLEGQTETYFTVTSFILNNPPVATLNGSNTQILERNVSYVELGSTCLDDEDGQIDGNVVIGGDVVDHTTVGIYDITYDCQDSGGVDAVQVTRQVTVLDSIMPMIIPSSEEPIEIRQDSVFNHLDYATCIDFIDDDLTNLLTVTSPLDTSSVGIKPVEYSCIDLESNPELLDIEFFVKKVSTSSYSSSSQSSSIPPPLFQQSEQEPEQDQGTTFADLFDDLVQNSLVVDGQQLSDPTPSQSAQSTSTPVASNTAQAIQNFFANLFNFFG